MAPSWDDGNRQEALRAEFLPVSIFIREIEDPQKISGVVFINGISAGRDADRLFYELQLILVLLIKAIYAVNEKNAAWC